MLLCCHSSLILVCTFSACSYTIIEHQANFKNPRLVLLLEGEWLSVIAELSGMHTRGDMENFSCTRNDST